MAPTALQCTFPLSLPLSNLETGLGHCSWWPEGGRLAPLWSAILDFGAILILYLALYYGVLSQILVLYLSYIFLHMICTLCSVVVWSVSFVFLWIPQVRSLYQVLLYSSVVHRKADVIIVLPR